MRKGRSQRKTRGSLPPVSRSQPPTSRTARALGAGTGPQVVIGITGPRSGEPGEGIHDAIIEQGETPASGANADGNAHEMRGSGSGSGSEGGGLLLRGSKTLPGGSSAQTLEVLELLAEPSLELVREEDRLELVREQNLELVRESLELIRETLDNEAANEEELRDGEPESFASESEQTELTETEPAPPAVHPDREPTFELIESQSLPIVTVAPLVAKGAQGAKGAIVVPTPDEMSIPPIGDLAVEPIADRFFSEGEIIAARGLEEEETWDHPADKGQRKSLPHVVERRARFSKYVRWAVGGAAVVCLAALARTVVMPSHTSSALGANAGPIVTSLQAPEAKAATPAVVEANAPPAPPPAPEATVDAPKVAVPAAATAVTSPTAEMAAAAAAPAETAKPEVAPAAPAAPAVATGDKTALQEKIDARKALERGKLADSIDAGERSVALDPTDGEAWLLLGAAYQEKGKMADARRCYTACTKEGKRGPLGECRAMLR